MGRSMLKFVCPYQKCPRVCKPFSDRDLETCGIRAGNRLGGTREKPIKDMRSGVLFLGSATKVLSTRAALAMC